MSTPHSPAKPLSRIPSLDGLRAISLIPLLASHLCGTRGFVAHNETLRQLGVFGLRTFFVLSGFLITTLILKEMDKKGSLDLAGFYANRMWRLLPPFLALVVTLGSLGALGLIPVSPSDVLHALTYTANYHPERGWYLSHTWSLAVEEQFYLLWPLVLCLGGRRAGKVVALAMVVAAPIVRVAYYRHGGYTADLVGSAFETVGDAIATGCLLAFGRDLLAQNTWYVRFRQSNAFALVVVVALASTFQNAHPLVGFGLLMTVNHVCVAMIIDRVVALPAGRTGRLLNHPAVVLVGTMSYSVYLWQQPFTAHGSASLVHTFPLNLALIVCASLASFYLIEQPVQRLRASLRAAPRRRSVAPAPRLSIA